MATAAPSDAELVKLAQTGQRRAFGLLVERHQDYVYNSVCYLVGGGQDAEDIAQEVFVSAYRALGRLPGPGAVHHLALWHYAELRAQLLAAAPEGDGAERGRRG